MRRGWKSVSEEYIKRNLENGAPYNWADFIGCILDGYDFSGKDLRSAAFIGASLVGANFRNAVLINANFENADLSFADFRGACIVGANFSNAELLGTIIPEYPQTCPSHGHFTGWKAAKYFHRSGETGWCIVKLGIPHDAIRTSGTGKKCRCSKAIVLAAYDEATGQELQHDYVKICSLFDSYFVYEIGDIIEPKKGFDPNRFNECSSGIHFFVDRKSAEQYLREE